MTTPVQTPIVELVGNGATLSFAYPYLVQDAAHMTVYLNEILQVGGYSVTGVGNPAGGTVDFLAAPGNGLKVLLRRSVPLSQLVDYVPYDPFPAEVNEQALDKAIQAIQDMRVVLSGTIRLADYVLPGVALTLPSVAVRANGLLGFDAAGNLIITVGAGTVTISAAMTPVVQAATLALARAAMGVSGGVKGAGRAITARTNAATPLSLVDITAGELVVTTVTGESVKLSAVAATSNIAAAGANGLDTGAEGASTWYYHYVIYNPTTLAVAGLISASATAPTLPAGYTYSALVSAVFNSAGSNFVPYRQLGMKIAYGPSQTVLNAGAAVAETAVSTVAFVPPIASHIHIILAVNLVNAAGAGTNTGGIRILTGVAFIGIIARDAFAVGQDANSLVVEVPNIAQNLFYINVPTGAPTTATLDIICLGFTLPGGGQ